MLCKSRGGPIVNNGDRILWIYLLERIYQISYRAIRWRYTVKIEATARLIFVWLGGFPCAKPPNEDNVTRVAVVESNSTSFAWLNDIGSSQGYPARD